MAHSRYLREVLDDLGPLDTRNPQCVPGKGNFISIPINPGTAAYRSINTAMQNTIMQHKGNVGGTFTSYDIVKMERIGNQSLKDSFISSGKNISREHSGFANERMLFHGTNSVTDILHYGFDKSETNPQGLFGGGFYFTDVSSKANQYVWGKHGCNSHRDTSCGKCPKQLLLCRVILGNSKELTSAMRYDSPPPGYHSVTGVPSQNGLRFKEYVVYKNKQARCVENYSEFLMKFSDFNQNANAFLT